MYNFISFIFIIFLCHYYYFQSLLLLIFSLLGNAELCLDSTEKLRWYAGKFLLEIRETCRISQTALDYIINGVQYLMAIYSSIILVMFMI